MIWITPSIIQAFLIILLVLLVVFYLWHKLRENEALKYEFITIITHKFRTPLTRTKWLLDDMTKSEPDSFRKENLASLQKENENLVKLIGTLIELTETKGKKESLYKFEHVDLCSFTREVLETVKQSFKEKNISVSFDCASPKIFAKIDRPRMEFVLSTILENACIYTPTGRRVSIVITTKHRKVATSVIDDGIGINPIDMPRIFTKFFRAKNAKTMDTEGFGVSLYLASSIVKRHSGKIEAFSAGLNTGSTFSVILPRVK
jgi:signal transduction histidine kinase